MKTEKRERTVNKPLTDNLSSKRFTWTQFFRFFRLRPGLCGVQTICSRTPGPPGLWGQFSMTLVVCLDSLSRMNLVPVRRLLMGSVMKKKLNIWGADNFCMVLYILVLYHWDAQALLIPQYRPAPGCTCLFTTEDLKPRKQDVRLTTATRRGAPVCVGFISTTRENSACDCVVRPERGQTLAPA